MKLSPETIAKVRGLIPVPFFIIIVAISLLEMTSTATELIPLLRAVAFILGALWLIAGAAARDASDTDRRAFRYWTAAALVYGLAAAPSLFGLVDDSIGTALVVAGFTVGSFLMLLGLMRPASAIALMLGALATLLLGGYAVSAGQILIAGAIAVIFSVAVVFIMVRRVNAGD